MTFMLFGVSNVGKATVGCILAEKLGCTFYDLDEEVKKYYHTTLEDFVMKGTVESRDCKRGCVIDAVMRNREDKVFAISPISYRENFERYLSRNDVFAIELTDAAENIFERLVFSDESDNVYEDDLYKNAHRDYYISEIKKDISWYGRSYIHVKNKFYMNNECPDIVADRLIREFNLLALIQKEQMQLETFG